MGFLSLSSGRGLALASLLCAAAAYQACAEGETIDDTQLPRKTGGAGTAGMSNGSSGSTDVTSGSGGVADNGDAGMATGAGGSNAGAAGSTGAGGGVGGGGANIGGASGSGGADGSGGTSGSAGAGGSTGSKDAGAAGAGGTILVSDAGPTCDYSKSPVYALIANQGNPGPNPTDNVIQFDFKLVNASANPVALSSLKVRYYFTDENKGSATAINFFSKIDGAMYVPVGDATMVHITRYDLTPAKTGADAYLEFTFDAALGSLPPNDYIFARPQFHHDDYRVFNESDDFSYNPGNNSTNDDAVWLGCKTESGCPSFANCKTVVLQDTTVVFGTPP